MKVEQRLLNTEEIAQLTGLSVRTVRYLVQQGRFPIPPTLKVGRRYMWDLKAVEQYLDKVSGIDLSSSDSDVHSEIRRLRQCMQG